MSNRHVSLCLGITHTKPLIRAALTLGPHKTLADGVCPVGDKGGGDVFWKTALTNLLSDLDKQQRKEQHKGIHEEGEKEWRHNPITPLFCQSMDWRNGAQKHFCSCPPCKAKQVLPLNVPPHFLNSPLHLQGPRLHPDHLRADACVEELQLHHAWELNFLKASGLLKKNPGF